MRLLGGALLLFVAGCGGLSREEQEFVDSCLNAPHAEDWKKVAWAADFEDAKARALREDKPIFVFFVVNEMAKPDAEHC